MGKIFATYCMMNALSVEPPVKCDPENLPVTKELRRIRGILSESRNLVLTASPGAGKTTIVPPALMNESWLQGRRIVMLQPRRVAALNSARRMAYLNGSPLGSIVGYQVRFDRKISRETRIEVLTEGLLTRRLQSDSMLEDVGLLIFDEFHERSIHADLGLAMAREIQTTVRPDLRIMVMSATFDPEPVAKFLGDCPILICPGFLYPVDISYDMPASNSNIPKAAARCIKKILLESASAGEIPEKARHPGVFRVSTPSVDDILVFLPGAGEIYRTMKILEEEGCSNYARFVPLHGSLPLEKQDEALRPKGKRKVILSTNIAETSLTVEGVTAIVDSGWCRMLELDPAVGLEKLELRRISRASADQRAGRAGRLCSGKAVRLWAESDNVLLAGETVPEIRRTDLTGVVLELAAWGKNDPMNFGWFEPPSLSSVRSAQRLLNLLGALDSEYRITELGKKMAAVPTSPRLSLLLSVAEKYGVRKEAADVAALISERDIIAFSDKPKNSRTVGRSDIFHRLDLLDLARKREFRDDSIDGRVDFRAAFHVDKTSRHLLQQAEKCFDKSGFTNNGPSDRETSLLKAIVAAYPDRIAGKRAKSSAGDTSRYLMVGGRGMRLSETSVVRNSDLIVAVAVDAAGKGETNEGTIKWASHVEPAWLEELFPRLLRCEREIFFDASRKKVAVRRRKIFIDLPLTEIEENIGESDAEAAERLLAKHALKDIDSAFDFNDEYLQLTFRLQLVQKCGNTLQLPDINDEWWHRNISCIVAGYKSFEDLRALSLKRIIESELSYKQKQMLDRLVPERIEVPSGSNIRLKYQKDGPPVLAVKLQEMFGLLESPKILDGTRPVLIHLLSPAGRPLQVTQDLANFWKSGYQQVRKEMRGRYPRHPWPEDPFTALPQRGVKKKS